ncbi:MAG: tetratricopeptide repeat protein [Dysgonomonas sp.]
MKRKFFLGALLSLLITTVSFAQSSLGEIYFYTGEYDAAKSFYETQISQSQSVAESYYYLGEIAWVKGDATTAKSDYEKGLAADPEFMLNNVGLGKLLLKTDLKTAEDYFSTAIKKNKKDVSVLTAIAYAYGQNGMQDKAKLKVSEAQKANKKSPYVYICDGDLFLMQKDASNAIQQYMQASYFDAENVVAHLKVAQAYMSTGVSGNDPAIEELQKALTIRPDYIFAYKYLGKIYYSVGNYTSALDAYQKYFQGGEVSIDDYINYAGALYFAGKHDDALVIVNQGLTKDPNNFVLNRLLMYLDVAKENYTEGLDVAKKFFSVNKGAAKYLANDYLAYGTLLVKNKQIPEALAQFNKAIEIEPENAFIYKEVADASSAAGDSREAAKAYKKYIELQADGVQAIDYFNLGKYYYISGRAAVSQKTKVNEAGDTIAVEPSDIALGEEELKEAIASFTKVVELFSDSYLGYLWRARAYSALDLTSEKGLAKPYYEETEKVILNSNKDVSPSSSDFKNAFELKEVYGYLSYYSYLQYEKSKSAEDKAKIKLYCDKLLTLDPNNQTAHNLLDYIK